MKKRHGGSSSDEFYGSDFDEMDSDDPNRKAYLADTESYSYSSSEEEEEEQEEKEKKQSGASIEELMQACSQGDLEKLGKLIKKNKQLLNQSDGDGWYLITKAIANTQEDIINLLLDFEELNLRIKIFQEPFKMANLLHFLAYYADDANCPKFGKLVSLLLRKYKDLYFTPDYFGVIPIEFAIKQHN